MRDAPNWNPDHPVVPVDKDGNWLAYPEWWKMKDGPGWIDVMPFFARLKVSGMETGRSAKRVVFEDVDRGITYPMFVSDLVKLLKGDSVTFVNGELSGTWTASKRGANYGIRAVL